MIRYLFLTAIMLVPTETSQSELLLTRERVDEWQVMVLRDTIIEHQATTVEHRDDGWVTLKGGDIQTDVAVVLLIEPTDPPMQYSPWVKMQTFRVGPDLGPAASRLRESRRELRRLNVYDVTLHEDHLFVAYSTDALVQVDIVAPDENNNWDVQTTIELFEQRHSEVHPHLVRSAGFVLIEDDVFLHFDVHHAHRETEIWSISQQGASRVVDEEVLDVVRDALHKHDDTTNENLDGVGDG